VDASTRPPLLQRELTKMTLTESEIKNLIDEEIRAMIDNGEIDEGMLDRLKARGAGALSRARSTAGTVGKSLGAKVTGAKAAAATALGADAAKLKDKQRGQQAAALDAKVQGAQKAAEAKIKSILSAHFERLKTDISKLGLGQDRKVQVAMQSLETAIELATAGAAAEG
jgi:hypothetical protein|tara:strand:+ start:9151 stop:9657 length:507 start_codon:yes stop_codon:yes gene_type:complete